MAVRLVCRACGKRLKLPDDGRPRRSARCPKCLAAIDLRPALEASAYKPAVSGPGASKRRSAPPASAGDDTPPPAPAPAALIGEEDPLPYPNPPSADSRPPLAKGPSLPPVQTPNTKHPTPSAEPLSLDDDPEPGELPPEWVPFRVAVQVLADSARQLAGVCFAVIVPHGVFLEREPMKPLVYAPVGCAVESVAAEGLTVTLPDRRAVTLRFTGRRARALARDTRIFLAGKRPAPVAADYRRKWWMLWPALVFALGMACGPLVLSRAAELGAEFGPKVGAGLALGGLFVNTLVALFSRRSVPGQVAVMAFLCALVTGGFLFGAAAYLAGRQRGYEEGKAEVPPPAPPAPPPPAPQPPPPEPPPRAPTHIDRAKKNGASALDDGPADVTALALAPDGNTLGIGYADGTTRLWPLDQPAFEAMLPGPKADGPVTRIQFDRKGVFVFAHAATGAVAAPRGAAPEAPLKILGTSVAIVPEVVNDRVRFAAVRGNSIQHRFLGTALIKNPRGRGSGQPFTLPGKGDEVMPADTGRDPNKPPGPTFLAWASPDRLLAGQPNGAIASWDATMKAAPPSNDHRAAVRAWALCDATRDFATGDDKGNVALWPAKGGKPTVWPVFDGAAVTGLAFSATGARLAVADITGWLVIWDADAGKAVRRVKRPAPLKAVAYGPTDDIFILAAGKAAEVWSLPQLLK